MKYEPLENKIRKNHFLFDDVKSAVEGLKQDMIDMFDTAKKIEDTIWYDEFTTLFDEIIFRIDKWFKDVIK